MLSFVQQTSDALDQMIESQTHATSTSLFEEYIAGSSWINKFSDLKKTFASLADPDALSLEPMLAKLFEEKTSFVKETFQSNPELMETLLIEISTRRKELGFDERARKSKWTGAAKQLDRASENSH